MTQARTTRPSYPPLAGPCLQRHSRHPVHNLSLQHTLQQDFLSPLAPDQGLALVPCLRTDLEKKCLVNVEENFDPLVARFGDAMGVSSTKIGELGAMKTALEEEVIKLQHELDDKLSLSKQMKVIQGLQGNLESAFGVISDGFGEEKQSISESPGMFNIMSDILEDMDSSESIAAE